MYFRVVIFITIITCLALASNAQDGNKPWNGHHAAVALTYDDGLAEHLDIVVPLLDSFGIKGTFYPNCDAIAFQTRIPEWRTAAANGHELGNHTLFHPCDATKPSRGWVNPDKDLSTYSVNRMVNEVRLANTLLNAVDGKTRRTFAYTCGDFMIRDEDFSVQLKDDFAGARGVQFTSGKKQEIDLMHIPAFSVKDHTGEALIGLVEQAIEHQLLIVFLFHGVGSDNSSNIDVEEHLKLIKYLAKSLDDVWVAPMVDIAEYLK